MNVEHIEKLKREYTDKYVAVDASQPDLGRFKNLVGRVKTVNMSGRALVEFLDYHVNIGWYDIDIDYLKVVEKPEAKTKEAAAKPAAKPATKAAAPPAQRKLSPLEMARAMDAKKKGESPPAKSPAPADAKKLSTADVLAAARGGQAPAEAQAEPAAKEKKLSPLEMARAMDSKKQGADSTPQTTPQSKTSSPGAQQKPPDQSPTPDRSKLSTADILARARAEKSGSQPPPAEPTQSASPATETEQPPQAEEPPQAANAAATGVAKVDRSKMSVEEMIAWCREHDG